MRHLLICMSHNDSLVVPFQHAHVDTRHSCRNKAETATACNDTTDVYEYPEKKARLVVIRLPRWCLLG